MGYACFMRQEQKVLMHKSTDKWWIHLLSCSSVQKHCHLRRKDCESLSSLQLGNFFYYLRSYIISVAVLAESLLEGYCLFLLRSWQERERKNKRRGDQWMTSEKRASNRDTNASLELQKVRKLIYITSLSSHTGVVEGGALPPPDGVCW